jgi:hypothetical protein
MPTIHSTVGASSKFKRVCGRVLPFVAAGGLMTGIVWAGLKIEKRNNENERIAQVAEGHRVEGVNAALIKAFQEGKDRITYMAGDTYRILSNVNVAGETVVSAHRVHEFGPNGEILRIYTEPAVVAKLPPVAPATTSAPPAPAP